MQVLHRAEFMGRRHGNEPHGGKSLLITFPDKFDRLLRRQEPLAEYTTFGIGGPAELLAIVDSPADLIDLVAIAREKNVPFVVMGEGSNILIGDAGIDGLVIVNHCRQIQRSGDRIVAEAGVVLNELVDFAIARGLAGLEKMAGIPGTVGGAIVGNAGAYGQWVADVLSSVELLQEDGRVIVQDPSQLGFAYRTSRLKHNAEIVLKAEFQLTSGSRVALRQAADEVVAQRESKLPSENICAGSYFKNIEDASAPYGKIPAGKLLEEVGAKELRVGKAAVSERHANVIVNLGGARATDVLKLAEKMKLAVKKKFGVELEEEVRFLGKVL